MTFGQKIKTRRVYIGMKQKELADAVGVHPHALRAWERDERMPSAAFLPSICKSLEVSADYLLGIPK